MNIGKQIRMDRIIDRKTQKTVIIPMDHGVSLGPIKGLKNMPHIVDCVARGGANAVILHKGIIEHGYRGSSGSGRDIGMIMHLSAGNNLGTNPNVKVPVATVKEAISYGADAVSVHVNVGSETEPEQLRHLGRTSEECKRWGMPLLAMMYPRGPKISNEDSYSVKYVGHAARLGAELGADIIKTNYTGDKKSFKEVVEGCPVPVVMAGGPKVKSEKDFFVGVYDSIKAGGSGVTPGRNVFQHDDPTYMVRTLCGIVHDGLDVEAALEAAKKLPRCL